MRSLLACLFFLVSTSVFAQDVVGTWLIDLDSLAADPKLKALPADHRKAAIDHARKLLAEMRIEARADGTARASYAPGVAEDGRWAKTAQGYTLTLKDATTPIVVEGDALVFTAKGTRLRFVREGGALKRSVDLAAELAGRWVLDADASKAAAPAGQRKQIEAMLSIVGGMVAEFGPGTLKMTVDQTVETGTFTLIETRDGITSIALTKAGEAKTERLGLRRVGATLHVSSGPNTLVFKR